MNSEVKKGNTEIMPSPAKKVRTENEDENVQLEDGTVISWKGQLKIFKTKKYSTGIVLYQRRKPNRTAFYCHIYTDTTETFFDFFYIAKLFGYLVTCNTSSYPPEHASFFITAAYQSLHSSSYMNYTSYYSMYRINFNLKDDKHDFLYHFFFNYGPFTENPSFANIVKFLLETYSTDSEINGIISNIFNSTIRFKISYDPFQFIPYIPTLSAIYSQICHQNDQSIKKHFQNLWCLFLQRARSNKECSQSYKKGLSKLYKLEIYKLICQNNSIQMLDIEESTSILQAFSHLIDHFKEIRGFHPIRILRSGNVHCFLNFFSFLTRELSKEPNSSNLVTKCVIEYLEFYVVQCMLFTFDVLEELQSDSLNQQEQMKIISSSQKVFDSFKDLKQFLAHKNGWVNHENETVTESANPSDVSKSTSTENSNEAEMNKQQRYTLEKRIEILVQCGKYFNVFPQNFTESIQFFYDEFNNFFSDRLIVNSYIFSGFAQRQVLDKLDDISFDSEDARDQVFELVKQDDNFKIDNFNSFFKQANTANEHHQSSQEHLSESNSTDPDPEPENPEFSSNHGMFLSILDEYVRKSLNEHSEIIEEFLDGTNDSLEDYELIQFCIRYKEYFLIQYD